MHLSKLRAQSLRLFQNLDLGLSPGINVFIGDNGAGKTSILEAADVLSRGKSFRAAHISEVIQRGQDNLMIAAEIVNGSDQAVQMGVAKGASQTQLRLNQQNVTKWSALTENLPLLAIHPESYQLITGGPGERRKYLDWGLFHVEPQFKKLWSDYARGLKQRNYCLRMQRFQEAKQWHHVLNDSGEAITNLRTSYITEIAPIVQVIAANLGVNDAILFEFKPGWDTQRSLDSLLDEELIKADKPYSTQYGPHRADLAMYWKGAKFAKTSSRGQQKILAIALKLAQAKHLFQKLQKASIYLIDELPAELDRDRCKKVLGLLAELNSQVLITSVSKEPVLALNNQEINWFHVERGQVTSML